MVKQNGLKWKVYICLSKMTSPNHLLIENRGLPAPKSSQTLFAISSLPGNQMALTGFKKQSAVADNRSFLFNFGLVAIMACGLLYLL